MCKGLQPLVLLELQLKIDLGLQKSMGQNNYN